MVLVQVSVAMAGFRSKTTLATALITLPLARPATGSTA